MTFVSYAQNFEDVLLWRALGHLRTGFYVDVGASHPDTDSVTRAFYDRGWHGINVEPTDDAFRRLAAARLRDVNLHLALGAAPGEATFYSVDDEGSGLSTLDAGAVARYAELGFTVRQTTVTVGTLAQVCRDHAPPDVHFLKIDVEGAERAVLQGADFAQCRPWIVLLEATAPMSTAEVHGAWEGLLLDADYRFVWFDGLNRYYVAAEHHDALSPAFHAPPNVFDDFLRAGDSEWTRRIEQAETRAAQLQLRAEAADRRTAIAEDRAEIAALRFAKATTDADRLGRLSAGQQQTLERLQQERDTASHQATSWLARAETAEQSSLAANAWLDAIRHSTSWRVTAPLRRAAGARARPEMPVRPEAEAPPPPAPAAAAPPPMPAVPEPVMAVHQFHSGSATGDAITNAMLVTRQVLRRLGYDSRIFVEHRDPACPPEIHHIDDLPPHDRFVLIVRHSMGHDALDRILALPVGKVLLYHNITPHEWLADSPFLQSYAQKGRDQLQALRPMVAAALADSDYNALELRQAGFCRVAACPMLFDVDALIARALPPAPQPGLFTVLFVGRITRSKGQLALIEAFARFNSALEARSRLVLVGRYTAGDPYMAELLALIRRHGLDQGAVEIAGHVPDDELARRYATAQLYVSCSHHEGFGVPLVEAIAQGVPVLATAAAAVPYTLGPDGLLDDAAPELVAGRMLDLARDPYARSVLTARQRAALDRFRLARHVPTLVSAIVQAGARPPVDAMAREALAAQVRVTVAGHVNGTYSLAEVNRALALALEADRPGCVRLLAIESDVTTDVTRVPPGQRDAVRPLLSRPPPTSGPHVVVSQHYPVWVPHDRGDLALALFFWEESLVPAATVDVLNAKFAGVLAPTRTVAKALIDSGVEVPVRLFAPVPQLARFRALRAERAKAPPSGPFMVLHVSSAFPRKGIDVLLAAYGAAFRADDAVRLVIKTFPNPHNDTAHQVDAFRAAHPDAAPVELIDADLSEDALLDLYRQAGTMVLPSRGEGYNLPAAEALAAGVPLIVTGMGGHMDFVDDAPGAVRLLRYRMAPSGSHLATPFSLWAEPDADDLCLALQEAAARGVVVTTPPPEPDQAASRLGAIAADLLLAPPQPPLDVAWVSTWDVRCGVAEYSRFLLRHLDCPVTVLADDRTAATSNSPAVLPCWRVGDPATLPALAAAIVRLDPRAVVVQHQPGLMGWGMLATLLAAPALQDRVVCAVLHNTRQLLEADDLERGTALAALTGASRVVVHTVDDLDRLAALGLAANVTMIPQGAPEPHASPPASPRASPRASAALDPASPVLIGCYGFFLPGKGMHELIEALSLLRATWPQARLRLVNAEYPLPESAHEIARCRALTAARGLEDAVTFVTAFLDPEESMARLAECDLVVLPYQSSKEASSAALRGTLATLVPVAVTPLPLFAEASGAAIVLPGIAPAAMAAGMDAVLRDLAARQSTVEAARGWLAARRWPAVAGRWRGLLRGLSASAVVAGAAEPWDA